MFQLFSLLALGFVFGIKHAFEADHIAAVSVLNSRAHTPRQAIIRAMYWGFGHTLTLFLAGAAVLILKINMTARFGEFLDRGISIMLIVLGIRALVIFFKTRKITDLGMVIHSHPPLGTHVHAVPSLFIGMIHGLAGSAAVLVLAISVMKSAAIGLIYIALFGLGSTLGMCMFSLAIGFSFTYLKKTASLAAGLFSVGAGVALLIPH